jgi:hypothetical protein
MPKFFPIAPGSLPPWPGSMAIVHCGAANTVVEIRENIPKRNENFAFM